ncbi:MAG: glutathione S-transferase family protein [Myxococcota bacterium]
MKPTLFSSPGSHNCRRVTVFIHELGVDVALKHVDVRPPGMGGENETDEFRAINPHAKVPVLKDGELVLFESNAIVGYLAQKHGPTPLFPQDPARRALVQQWQFWQGAHLSPAADGLLAEHMVKPMLGKAADPEAVASHLGMFHRWARVLEDALSRGEYLVDGTFTYADISVAAALMYATPAEIPIAEHPPVEAWLARVHARPSWEATKPPPMG